MLPGSRGIAVLATLDDEIVERDIEEISNDGQPRGVDPVGAVLVISYSWIEIAITLATHSYSVNIRCHANA
ncbi:MAG: hypothetical protein RLN60_03460 [Phycisphaerales bacterium]